MLIPLSHHPQTDCKDWKGTKATYCPDALRSHYTYWLAICRRDYPSRERERIELIHDLTLSLEDRVSAPSQLSHLFHSQFTRTCSSFPDEELPTFIASTFSWRHTALHSSTVPKCRIIEFHLTRCRESNIHLAHILLGSSCIVVL